MGNSNGKPAQKPRKIQRRAASAEDMGRRSNIPSIYQSPGSLPEAQLEDRPRTHSAPSITSLEEVSPNGSPPPSQMTLGGGEPARTSAPPPNAMPPPILLPKPVKKPTEVKKQPPPILPKPKGFLTEPAELPWIMGAPIVSDSSNRAEPGAPAGERSISPKTGFKPPGAPNSLALAAAQAAAKPRSVPLDNLEKEKEPSSPIQEKAPALEQLKANLKSTPQRQSAGSFETPVPKPVTGATSRDSVNNENQPPSNAAAPTAAASSSTAPLSAFDDLKQTQVLSPSPKKNIARQKGRRPPRKPMRIYNADDTYKSVAISTTATVTEIVDEMREKNHIEPDQGTYCLYEVDTSTGAEREIETDEIPLAVIMGWSDELRPHMRIYFKQRTKTNTKTLKKMKKDEIKHLREREKQLVKRTHYAAPVLIEWQQQMLEVAVTADAEIEEFLQSLAQSAKLGDASKLSLHEVIAGAAPKPVDSSASPFEALLAWANRPGCHFVVKK